MQFSDTNSFHFVFVRRNRRTAYVKCPVDISNAGIATNFIRIQLHPSIFHSIKNKSNI